MRASLKFGCPRIIKSPRRQVPTGRKTAEMEAGGEQHPQLGEAFSRLRALEGMASYPQPHVLPVPREQDARSASAIYRVPPLTSFSFSSALLRSLGQKRVQSNHGANKSPFSPWLCHPPGPASGHQCPVHSQGRHRDMAKSRRDAGNVASLSSSAANLHERNVQSHPRL